MELIIGSAMTIAFFAGAFFWARRAYRDGYMEGLKDSKIAFDMMIAKGQIMLGPEPYEEANESGDFGPIPATPKKPTLN